MSNDVIAPQNIEMLGPIEINNNVDASWKKKGKKKREKILTGRLVLFHKNHGGLFLVCGHQR